MNEPFSDELLSAYLDGELLGEERERVEEWLAASADHRRLLDDLKAIRRELQALPRQTLDAGFADRVLVAIHQRTGEPNGPPTDSEAAPPSAEQVSSIAAEPVNLPKKDLGMPAWRWFAAGVAATLLAMIAGINAAPQTMTQIGKVAQVRQSIEPGPEPAHETVRESPSSGTTPTAIVPPGESVPTPELAQRDSADASQQIEARTFSRAMNKAATELRTDADRQPKENAPAPPGQPKAESPPLPAPSVVADSAPAAPPAGLESADENFADRRGSGANATKKSRAGGFAKGGLPATYDDVVELPVTSEQADRALAFYAQTATRQAAQRLKSLERVESFAEATDEYAAGKALEQQKEQDVLLKGTAPAMTLMKLMDAAGDGVQIAAVEVTGSEAEVAALLDTLGVSEARKLATQSQVLRARGAGGVVAMQPDGQKAAGEGVESIPKAAALAEPGMESPAGPVAKADAAEKKVAKKAEEDKGVAGPGGGSGARDKFRGNSPAVRMRSLAGSGAAGREPASLSGAAEQSAQPQLRVRLVIVPPAADPIGPTIELKPQE